MLNEDILAKIGLDTAESELFLSFLQADISTSFNAKFASTNFVASMLRLRRGEVSAGRRCALGRDVLAADQAEQSSLRRLRDVTPLLLTSPVIKR